MSSEVSFAVKVFTSLTLGKIDETNMQQLVGRLCKI